MIFRPARKNEIQRCAQLASKSFEDYVFYKMFPMRESARIRFIHAIMSTGIRCAYAEDELFVADDNGEIVAVAILEKPDKKPVDDSTYLRNGGWKVLLTGGKDNTIAWMKMLEECDSAIHSLSEAHWYLSSLTIADGRKGQGFGSRTIQDGIIPHIKEMGGGVLTLITNSDENRRFYEKNGFSVFEQREILRGDRSMTNWSFRMLIEE